MKRSLIVIAVILIAAMSMATLVACNNGSAKKPVDLPDDAQLLSDKATLENNGYTVNVVTGDVSPMEESIKAQEGSLQYYISVNNKLLYIFYFDSAESANDCYESNGKTSSYKLYKHTLIFGDDENLLGK